MFPGTGLFFFFFFNDTATTEIYTLSLHDALPIFLKFVANNGGLSFGNAPSATAGICFPNTYKVSSLQSSDFLGDRKSTRLNSSHLGISYAVFCLKKKISLT